MGLKVYPNPDGTAIDGAAPPAVSVVIPAYNAARFLGACYAGLAAQTFRDREAIIVDDGSTDNTLALARGLGDPRVLVRSQPNGGAAVARNHGRSLARGAAILFLDADDALHPTALARLHAALAAAPAEVVAVYGRYRIVGADGAPHPRHANWRQVASPSGDLLEPLLVEDLFAVGTVLARRRRWSARAHSTRPCA
jgi:glycosyltransferase involved in cell wall biosynthesis